MENRNLTIKNFRKKINVTQTQLADLLGVKLRTVQNWEDGQNMPLVNSLAMEYIEMVGVRKVNDQIYINRPIAGGGKLIPFFNVDFLASEIAIAAEPPIAADYFLDIPAFAGCKAFMVFGPSMEPTIDRNSMVFARKIEDMSVIEYGEIYGLVHKDGRKWLKKVRRGSEAGLIMLVSDNPGHDPFEIELDDIASLWLIHGWIVRRK